MEGISQEAIALAGHLRLNKLIVLFDDNGISIDGPLSLADCVDQVKRFESAGWTATRIDGHDPAAIAAAIETAQNADRPLLIACRTTIGFGAPTKAGTASRTARRSAPTRSRARANKLGWTPPPFEIPADILRAWREAGERSTGAMPTGAGASPRSSRQARRVRAPHERRPAGAGFRRRRRRGQGRSSPPRRRKSPPARLREFALETSDSGAFRKWSAARPTSPAPTTPAPNR